ncbi:hypothetical protein Taro_028786 [Colocasia esculenta]|uniref:Uncharacterized protein n=1 Tax=Colocasia esculenta TaxID=4460 RepID=A0A843VV75_COLES|nr:hypothetical protein [Colocasia esculenta]
MLQPIAKHESESTTPPHGTDYWFMTPVSNLDNTTQELPVSLAVTDVRSNCRSTTQVNRTTTLPESKSVQEDEKTPTVPLHRDKPRAHTGAWLT